MGKRNKGNGVPRPPQLVPEIRVSKIFRYQSNAAGTQTLITVANLQALLVFALTATTTTRLFRSIRLRKVEVWAIGAQNAASERVAVTGGGDGPANTKADVSMGVTPAHVVWRPAPQSRSALWYDSGSSEASNLIELDYPNSAIFDVTVEFIMVDSAENGPVPGPATAGATAGTLYGCTLDSTGRTGSGKLQPQDYTPLP